MQQLRADFNEKRRKSLVIIIIFRGSERSNRRFVSICSSFGRSFPQKRFSFILHNAQEPFFPGENLYSIYHEIMKIPCPHRDGLLTVRALWSILPNRKAAPSRAGKDCLKFCYSLFLRRAISSSVKGRHSPGASAGSRVSPPIERRRNAVTFAPQQPNIRLISW